MLNVDEKNLEDLKELSEEFDSILKEESRNNQRMHKKSILFGTKIGSHLWGMNTPESDNDYFMVYLTPSKDFLRGTAKTKSKHLIKGLEDVQYHEVGKVVDELIKGNINYLTGVMSPLVVKNNYFHRELKKIVTDNLSKATYHSIHGLTVGNYKKYVESKQDASEKRCNRIARYLIFGQKLLSEGKLEFSPASGFTPELIPEEIHKLTKAYCYSELLEMPESEPFREWLLRVRMCELKGMWF